MKKDTPLSRYYVFIPEEAVMRAEKARAAQAPPEEKILPIHEREDGSLLVYTNIVTHREAKERGITYEAKNKVTEEKNPFGYLTLGEMEKHDATTGMKAMLAVHAIYNRGTRRPGKNRYIVRDPLVIQQNIAQAQAQKDDDYVICFVYEAEEGYPTIGTSLSPMRGKMPSSEVYSPCYISPDRAEPIDLLTFGKIKHLPPHEWTPEGLQRFLTPRQPVPDKPQPIDSCLYAVRDMQEVLEKTKTFLHETHLDIPLFNVYMRKKNKTLLPLFATSLEVLEDARQYDGFYPSRCKILPDHFDPVGQLSCQDIPDLLSLFRKTFSEATEHLQKAWEAKKKPALKNRRTP